MKPFYLSCRSGHSVAAIYHPPAVDPKGSAVLLVPPLGWDDQTSYRPRRDWSLALAGSGFANLRIELPGTGDSSGTALDENLVEAWSDAVAAGVEWLRALGTKRIAVIALGGGGLVTLDAIARGTRVEDLVLWGTPASGRALVREIRAFARLERSNTGETGDEGPEGGLVAGGHMLAPATMNALSRFEAASFAVPRLKRALVLGRDGIGPENALVNALRASGAEVLTDPGRGWGIALARPQSALPEDIFDRVGTWLAAEEEHCELGLAEPTCERAATLGQVGERVHEEAIVFSGAGQQLFAVISEPVDVPAADCTLILFNAGAIRRIGPNRMWTEAARRWASAGVPALRVDLEGIGDAAGDGSRYVKSDEPFYTRRLVEQARAALDLAVERGLPSRFVVAGLCSGAFWAFQLALSDPRVEGVIALNPRMLVFDRNVEGGRELRKLHRILTPAGFKTMLLKDHKLERLQRVGRFLLEAPARMVRRESQASINELAEAFSRIRTSGKHLHLAFSGDEPLYEELRKQGIMAQLEQLGARLCELPFKSHTLKPLAAQVAAHAVIDEGVACTLQAASKIRPAQARRRPQARRKRSEPRFDTAVPFRDMPSSSIA